MAYFNLILSKNPFGGGGKFTPPPPTGIGLNGLAVRAVQSKLGVCKKGVAQNYPAQKLKLSFFNL